ncbi:GerMN domain-containing protein [Christensenellaceae bacterium OttesenSCG-928-L17]|nr:GerMN domain-containing protein [Christensenellaceae bacterium OttesenSCG-928-L17]
MKRSCKVLSLVLLVALLLPVFGCMHRIQEDGIRETLPPIYPDEGIGRNVDVTLYFRLTDEALLVPVKRTVSVRTNENTAEVVIRELIQGPDAIYSDLSGVLPSDAWIVDFSLEESGKIAYLTLNDAVLDKNKYGSSRSDQELAQRLGVYAMVNSLCALSNITQVQIMVDTTGTGIGRRVSPFQFGFSSSEMSSDLMEPMGKTDAVIYTETKLVELAFSHLVEGEFTRAYRLFAEYEPGGLQKPDYAAFETEMLSLGTIDGYHVKDVRTANAPLNGAVDVDFEWTARSDGITRTTSATLLLVPEGELFKLGYYSLTNAMQASLQNE